MYNLGDFIIYGSSGVCLIENIGAIDTTGAVKGRIYYTLRPYYSKGSTIFTPADNNKVLMRPVLSKEEAMMLIDDIKNIDCLWIADEKKRELEYKEAIKKCDCKELVKIIKAIYLRKQERIAEGKKVTASDEKYFYMAEENLYGELAIALGMDKEETKDFVIAKVEHNTVTEG